MTQELHICGTQSCLGRGKLEVVISKAFEEGATRLDMHYRIGIEHNDTVEVWSHLLKIFNHLIDHLDEPPRRSAAVLNHNEPLIGARGCADRRQGHRILTRLNMVERGNQVEQGKHPS